MTAAAAWPTVTRPGGPHGRARHRRPPTERLAPEVFAERAQAIEREVGTVIVGQRDLVRQTLTGLLAN